MPPFIVLFFLLFGCQWTIQAQPYCTPCLDDAQGLFYLDQAEPVLGDTVTYATRVFSIDEWDNNLGCGFANQCENLGLEVYYPDIADGEKRPLVVLIHGGGFMSGNRAAFRATAQLLARKGYVAATISYRLCKRNNCLVTQWATQFLPPYPTICNLNFWSDLGQSSYVAVLDAQNAIRYLQAQADTYHIDPNKIIVGGGSAGGWTAQHVAFLDQEEFDAFPGSENFRRIWGPLQPVDGIVGVLNLAGALLDTTIIDEEEAIPSFLVAGTCDPVICYDKHPPFHCSNYPDVYGGATIAQRMHNLGHPYYLFSAENVGHNVSPQADIWMDQFLRYARWYMLCSASPPAQKHVAATLLPPGDECDILESYDPMPINHPGRQLIALPLSDLLEDCLPVQTAAPTLRLPKIYPVPSADGLVYLGGQGYKPEALYDTQGKLQPLISTSPGWLQLPPRSGIYFLLLIAPDEQRHWVRLIRS